MTKKRKSATFATALVEAQRELAKANKRKIAAQAELAAVNVEIPALQRTIAALQGQVEGKPVTKEEWISDVRAEGDSLLRTASAVRKLNELVYSEVVPRPEVTAGMSSVPAASNQPPARELTEDELFQMPTLDDIQKTVPKKGEVEVDPFRDDV